MRYKPEGGVKEGQLFRAQVLNQAKPTPTINNNPHNIPVGQWRNGLFECCAHGCCHPMCCLASWCRPLALGQVMTRMNLDPCGNPDVQGTSRTCGPFKVMVALTVALYCGYYICLVIAAPINTASNAGGYGASGEDFGPNDIVTALYQIFSIAISMYFLIVTCKTRAHLRRTYNIPETSCNGCEDCCCAYWCGCCTLAQMARHTADYETYPAACCSETGLNNRAPPTLARAPPTLAPHIV